MSQSQADNPPLLPILQIHAQNVISFIQGFNLRGSFLLFPTKT